ncbi:hypothetical protein VC218_17535 [Xanthomonas nasturtii]|uniref:hypothetical protein n=1 Tax=Xanthomonas nasturtii TaxID=1843581 RepID=UPI002B229DD9|nr:hypothetical protein [Xanthomonas nasturtii]MEA9580634.1 hypothetical protein [Xanthomonas nasturtii]
MNPSMETLGGIHAAKGPASGECTAPGSLQVALLKARLLVGLQRETVVGRSIIRTARVMIFS